MQKNNAKRIIEHLDAATHERLTKCDNITEVQNAKILEGKKKTSAETQSVHESLRLHVC